MQYSFLLWPLEQPYMASPRKPTQLIEFLDVAFEATISSDPVVKSKELWRVLCASVVKSPLWDSPFAVHRTPNSEPRT
jgi:hypothetical protein